MWRTGRCYFLRHGQAGARAADRTGAAVLRQSASVHEFDGELGSQLAISALALIDLLRSICVFGKLPNNVRTLCMVRRLIASKIYRWQKRSATMYSASV